MYFKILLVLKSLSLKFSLFEIKRPSFIWEGSWIEYHEQGCSLLIGCLFPSVPGLGEYWSRLSSRVMSTSKQMWLSNSDSSSWVGLEQLSFPQCSAEGSLYFPVFYCCRKNPWPLHGMEWACLSPKCKCHFSTSLVTTPFLAFIDDDIFLCSLSPTHAAGRQGQLLYLKRLKRKCRDL